MMRQEDCRRTHWEQCLAEFMYNIVYGDVTGDKVGGLIGHADSTMDHL